MNLSIVRSVQAACLIACLSASSGISASQEEAGVVVRNPSPSPDGTQFVFEASFDGPLNLWVSTQSGAIRKLTLNSGNDESPAWSPKGGAIAFSSSHNGVSDIWVIAPDGSGLRQLTANALNNRQPAWSPDGRMIAFVGDRAGSRDIWIMNADGSAPRRLTSLPGQENHPSFSPAGDGVAFSYSFGGNASIYRVNLDGTGLARLTQGGSSTRDWNPQWTLQGILFSSDRDKATGHWTPWMVQPNGGGMIQISTTPALDPVMLPSGQIVFSDEFSTASSDQALSHITLLSPGNGAKQQITNVQGPFASGDVNLDGSLTCADLVAVRSSVGRRYGSAGFNPRADVNGDGVVDVKDVAAVAQKLPAGTVCK